jgi:hypothetical protein
MPEFTNYNDMPNHRSVPLSLVRDVANGPLNMPPHRTNELPSGMRYDDGLTAEKFVCSICGGANFNKLVPLCKLCYEEK